MKNMDKAKVLWVNSRTKILKWYLRLQGHVEEVELKMESGAYYSPKKNEDAHFICAEEQTIGVADGVGSWASKGVDAGEYSRELMRNSEKSVLNQHKAGEEINPIKVLEEAYTNTKHIKHGSSTACIVTLKNTKRGSVRSSAKATLHAANIGDSGFMVFRKNHNSCYELKGQSLPLRKGFNFPYQLGNGKNNDSPDSADEIEIIDLIEAEDVIVVATDGLFDNVFPHEIGAIIDRHDFKTEKPEELANWIGRFAAYKSKDRHCDTPFARAAREAGRNRVGGKIDDITVVVGVILGKTRLVPNKRKIKWKPPLENKLNHKHRGYPRKISPVLSKQIVANIAPFAIVGVCLVEYLACRDR